MLIVWGKKVRNISVGATSRFCPICRDMRDCRIIRAVEYKHVYFLTYGKGTPVMDVAACSTCSCEFPGSVGEFETVPAHEQASTDERQKLEARARTGQLTSTEREALLLEPFIALEYRFRSRLQGSSSNTIFMLLVLLTVVLAGATVVTWVMVPGSTPREKGPAVQYAIIATFSFIITLALSIWLGMTMHGRQASSDELPRLAKSLAALNPTVHELEATFATLNRQRLHVVRGVSVRDLRAAIERSKQPDSR